MMKDETFDYICKHLLDSFEAIQSDPFMLSKELFTKEGLNAGTGHHLKGKYPSVIERIAHEVVRQLTRAANEAELL